MRTVDFYLDFISPYTWLALNRAEGFAASHDVAWKLRPVVYGALLSVHGLVGPVETAAKRRYTFYDVARCAHQQGLRFVGPPSHPFRSLEALRALLVFRGAPQALALACALSNAAWAEGRDLTDSEVIADAVRGVGLEAGSVGDRLRDPAVKAALRTETEGAIEQGVFGVPTFVLGGELFWGNDRLEHLARRLAGEAPDVGLAAEQMLARRAGVERQR